jgi:hypothetical protein
MSSGREPEDSSAGERVDEWERRIVDTIFACMREKR